VNISYEHANPRRGNESFLIRIEEGHTEMTPCLLVDAGDGVNTEELLGEDEYLAAILLTHAHLDHYQSLGEAHRDAAPILTSAGTASILEDVLSEGSDQYGLTNTEEVLNRAKSVSEWHNVLGETLRVRPVPVGHTPGACGFLIRVDDGDDQVTMLATGDFTKRDAAGYRGFDAEAYPEVDILFLTAATNERFGEDLTDTVGTISERTNAGSRTLCTASGLTGVHLATVLAGVDDELDVDAPVILAGQVAKLYTALGYEHDAVETVPEFGSTGVCFEHGAVTIAGPEVPVEGSSARLFGAIADDPSASLVQVQGGNTDAVTGSDFAGTVSSHRFSNHPTEAVLDDVVETISPTHVVVTHQRGQSLDRYKDKWDSFSWATGSRGKEVLYRDGAYLAPPWVSEHVERRVRNRAGQFAAERVDAAVLDAVDAPPASRRRDEVDLGREGVDVEVLRNQLHIRSEAGTSASTTSGAERAGATDGGSTETVEPMSSGSPTTEENSPEEEAVANGEEPTLTGGDDELDSARDTNEFSVPVDPAISLLAQQRAEAVGTPLAVFVRDTVDAYIADILRGDEPWDDVEQEEEADSLSLDTGPVLGALLSSAATDYDSVEVFALEYLRDAAGVDEADGTIPVRDNKSIAGLLDAVVENEDSPSESSGDIVEDALRREFS
jgi:putative mRNA 3-end processing factor